MSIKGVVNQFWQELSLMLEATKQEKWTNNSVEYLKARIDMLAFNLVRFENMSPEIGITLAEYVKLTLHVNGVPLELATVENIRSRLPPKDWREVFDRFGVTGLRDIGFEPDLITRLTALREYEKRPAHETVDYDVIAMKVLSKLTFPNFTALDLSDAIKSALKEQS